MTGVPLPTALAAVAAFFSALAAGLTYFIHRRNLLESIRPELTIENCTFSEDEDSGHLTIVKIRNVGKGIALNINQSLCVKGYSGSEPAGTIESRPLLLLPASESYEVNLNAFWSWKYGTVVGEACRLVPLELLFQCQDVRGNRYQTTYSLVSQSFHPQVGFGGVYYLAPQVAIMSRQTKQTSSGPRTRMMKFLNALANEPKSYS